MAIREATARNLHTPKQTTLGTATNPRAFGMATRHEMSIVSPELAHEMSIVSPELARTRANSRC